MKPDDLIRAALVDAARELGAPDTITAVLERPRDPANGDWSTNLAMMLAKPLAEKPRVIAARLVDRLDLGAAGVSKVDIAGPGFINFYLAAGANASGLASIVAQGEGYGRNESGAGQRVVVEFVSANPTGPLHVGHGRQAVLGDAISALLEWTGWKVSREYYYNDAGVQIQNLAASVVVRLRELAAMRRISELKSRLQRMNPVTQTTEYNRLFGELVALEQHSGPSQREEQEECSARLSLIAARPARRETGVVVIRGEPER